MPAHSVAVSDDGSKLVAAGASIRVWDVSSGSKLGKVPGQAAQVVAAQFAPDNVRACPLQRTAALAWPFHECPTVTLTHTHTPLLSLALSATL